MSSETGGQTAAQRLTSSFSCLFQLPRSVTADLRAVLADNERLTAELARTKHLLARGDAAAHTLLAKLGDARRELAETRALAHSLYAAATDMAARPWSMCALADIDPTLEADALPDWLTEAERPATPGHSCDNCDGIDPDSCLFRSDEPPAADGGVGRSGAGMATEGRQVGTGDDSGAEASAGKPREVDLAQGTVTGIGPDWSHFTLSYDEHGIALWRQDGPLGAGRTHLADFTGDPQDGYHVELPWIHAACADAKGGSDE